MRRILDVAGFTVDAVLRVDLELLLAVLLLDHFVDARRAVTLRGFVELDQIREDGDRVVGQLQVAGLVFLVKGVGEEDR